MDVFGDDVSSKLQQTFHFPARSSVMFQVDTSLIMVTGKKNFRMSTDFGSGIFSDCQATWVGPWSFGFILHRSVRTMIDSEMLFSF